MYTIYNFGVNKKCIVHLTFPLQTLKPPYPATLSVAQACGYILTLLRYGYE